jgi:uncharacterized protein (DUF1778 family)
MKDSINDSLKRSSRHCNLTVRKLDENKSKLVIDMFDKLVELLDNIPQPSQKLKDAVLRYKSCKKL